MVQETSYDQIKSDNIGLVGCTGVDADANGQHPDFLTFEVRNVRTSQA
jgi:hypothetical protein